MAAVAVLYGAMHAHRPAGVDAGLAAVAGASGATGAGHAVAAVNGATGTGAGEAGSAGTAEPGAGTGAAPEGVNAIAPGSASAASTAENQPAGGRSDSAGGGADPAGDPGPAGLSQAGQTTTPPPGHRSGGSGSGGYSNSGAGRATGTGGDASSPAPPSHSAPAPPAKPGAGEFTIVVSEDNGATVIAKKTVPIVTGESLMDYMHQYFTITTAYGDNFMVSINGIKSQWTGVPVDKRQPVDWFLYVNGNQAQVGAADIYPHAGDVDTWDYHRWDPAKVSG